jgi:hypothetical protein
MRRSWPVAPAVRAAQIVGASVRAHPAATAGTTTSGLKTPKAAAITSPGTWPMTDPRLQK